MNPKFTIAGRLEKWGDVQDVGKAKPFKKREIVVETSESGDKYPNPIIAEITGKRIDEIAAAPVGSIVELDFYLRGREYNGRYYVALSVCALRIVAEAPPMGEPADADAGSADEGRGNLPF